MCPGRFLTYDLAGSWNRDLDEDLRAIRDWGACALVTLMEAFELVECGVGDLPGKVPEGIVHFRLPIPDGGVPDEAWERAWVDASARIRALLRQGRRVVIHCLGGLGRTGMVSARLLVEFGMDPEEAIAAVRKARPGAIENEDQEDYVRGQKPAE
jgi:ADP-ribosyl-[dinitrogen reductase] hydrolase